MALSVALSSIWHWPRGMPTPASASRLLLFLSACQTTMAAEVAWRHPIGESTMLANLAGSMAVSQCGKFREQLWEARGPLLRKEYRCWEKKSITFRISSSLNSNSIFLREKSKLRVTQVRASQGTHHEIGRNAEVLGSKAALNESVEEHQRPLLCFPGGAMFFYWQIGAVSALRKYYNINEMDFSGASAGALAATLAACHVDGRGAAEVALQLSKEAKLWDSYTGLLGVWGGLIRQWLHVMLPADAAERCNGRLHLHVLELPSVSRKTPGFVRRAVNSFEGKEDLIECCMASVHIPLFMDGKAWTVFRDRRTLDGSILQSRESVALGGDRPALWLDYTDDETMAGQRLKLLSLGQGPEETRKWIEEMMNAGEEYVESLYVEKQLNVLSRQKLL